MKRSPIWLIVLAVIVVAAAGVVVWQGMSPAAAPALAGVTQALIAPADYQAEFGSTGARHLLVDVRTPEEFAEGHIAGAVNISLQTLSERLNEIPRDQPVVVYCRSGNRSAQASQILAQAGYTTIYDLGGIIAWQQAGLPIQ